MYRNIKSFFMLLAVVCFVSFSAIAQETTGTIEGTVKDPNGAVVPGVVVIVTPAASGTTGTGTATGFSRRITSTGGGTFRIEQVPPGRYTVSVEAAGGFGTATTNNVEVLVGRSTVVNINVAIAGTDTVIDVLADETITIDPTSNKVQSNITAAAIELLPKGTNFSTLLQTTPSVRNEPLSGGFQIDGASGSENTFNLDGQEVNNFRTGTLDANNNVPFQIVQEITVKSGGFEAEFGGATGGVISATTKSGSNQLRGEIGTSFGIAKFQGNPRQYFRQVTGQTVVETVQPPKDGGTNFFPFVSLGGPIIKDKMWFFGAWAPQFRNIDRTIQYVTNDPATRTVTGVETYALRQKREYGFGKIDFQPFQSLRLSGSYLWNPIEQIGAPPAFSTAFGTVPQLTFPTGEVRRGSNFLNVTGGRQTSNNTNGSLTWTPTNRFTFAARGGYGFLNEKIGNYGVPSVGGLTRWVVQNTGTAPPANFGATVGQNFPGFSELLFDATIRRTFDADASYLVDGVAGRHLFKGGFQFNGISNKVQSTLVDTIVIRFGPSQNIADWTGRNVPTTPGSIGFGWLQRFGVFGSAGSNNKALYIQDSWQPFRTLTLNIGIRAEKEDSPSFSPGNPGITFGWGDKIAPRLGFAWDILGDGRNKLFGSYGRFFDRFKYELPRGSFGGNFFRNDYFEIFPGQTIGSFTRATVINTNPDPVGGNCPLPASSGLSRCQLDFRIPSNLVGGDIFDTGGIDPDIRAFQQSEYTLGFERDLGRGYFFTSRYTRKQVDYAVEDIGLYASTGGEAYIIGNPGFGLAAQISEGAGFVALKAVRDYDAAEFRVVKRFATKAFFDASYTYSRLFGNYAGLASSDEAGRTSPNVNRNFDLPFIGFSASGGPDNGRMATDRPHSVKVSGAYTKDWSGTNATEFSAFFIGQSGTPITTRFTFAGVAGQILNGRGDQGRTELFTQTDFAVSHKYRFGRDNRFTMAFDVDILNLFNEKNVLSVNETISTRSITFGPGDLNLTAQGDTVGAARIFQQRATNAQILPFVTGVNQSPLFLTPTAYQGERNVRFGFRLRF